MSRKFLLYTLIAFCAVSALIAATTRLHITKRFEGLFLLRGEKGKLFELKDDLYLGDGSRLIYALDFDSPRFSIFHRQPAHKPGEPYLDYEWDEKNGSGYVWNCMPDGTKMLTCMSRFVSSSTGSEVHGLFVGGGLPSEVHGDDYAKMSESGMAYYDGKRWYHIWCNVNEGISPVDQPFTLVPAQWEFLGSKVLNASPKALALTSRHRVVIGNVPMRIDRYAYFRAGDTYFIISIWITNEGREAVGYDYKYGDEPWVGNYGSSEGNVGWVSDRIINYAEWVDTSKYSYAGIFDYGNDAIGEGHGYTRTANFIEWLGPNRPTNAFFSNSAGEYPDNTAKEKKPLYSQSRFIGVVWANDRLAPGETKNYVLAIGMAGHDPVTDFPVKPNVGLGRGR